MSMKINKTVLKIELIFVTVILFYKFYGFSSEVINQSKIAVEKSLKKERPKVEKILIYSKKAEKSDEKIMRKGLLVMPKNAKANILICHGFTCDKNDIGFLRYMFKDCNSLTFDFRAHGECREGQVCTLGKNEAYDVIAAAKFLKNRPEAAGKPLIVYAFSMGAVASIEAAAKEQNLFDAMILDCPFDSTENVINRGLDNKKISIFGYEFGIPGRTILRRYLFHPYVQAFVKAMLVTVGQINNENINVFAIPVFPIESIKKVNVPCFFIHCKNDEKIAIENIKAIYYNAASKYKKLWLTDGKKHFGSFFNNPEEYAQKVKGFVAKVVNGEILKKNKHKILDVK